MERHPSTTFIVTTNRHATEQDAMDRADAIAQSKAEALMLAAPDTRVVYRSVKAKLGYDAKYSGSAKVTVSYL